MAHATIPNRPLGSDPRSIADILANFDAITTQLNGNLGWENTGTANNGLAKGAFHAFRSAAYVIPATPFIFEQESFDISGWYDVATGQYTPTLAGYYYFNWRITVGNPAGAGEQHASVLVRTGTDYSYGDDIPARGIMAQPHGGSAIVQANGTTHVFRIRMISPIGANAGTGQAITFFSGFMIGKS
jgi:hypothetical protein